MAAPGTSVPGTSAGGMHLYGPRAQAPEGQFTSTVYSLIRDGKYTEAIRLLMTQLQSFPRSRPALSLLGHCYYQLRDYRNAAQTYEELIKTHPDVESYGLYYAQSLYKAGLYPEATRACQRIDSESEAINQRLLQLQAAIRYDEEDLPAASSLLLQAQQRAVERNGAAAAAAHVFELRVNEACITYKQGGFAEAAAAFSAALEASGRFSADLAYNVALCHYASKDYETALRHVSRIVEVGVREHPELRVGSGAAAEGATELRSVGNTSALRESALVEALNLKAAIELNLKNLEAARESLSDLPPRAEDELDPVTLHNLALVNIDTDPTGGFRKLNFLLTNPPFPPETFGNLLLLYVKYGCLDLVADVMAENTALTFKFLRPDLYEFLDATIMVQTSPAEAYRKYDQLAARHIEDLRKHSRAIQDARNSRDTEAVRTAASAYEASLEAYVPVLMGTARIYWEMENYQQVERIFRQAAEFASENDTWKLNMAHAYFLQETKFREAISYYEPLVKAKWDSILDVTAIVLANLCVAYIMTAQNEEAENVMLRIEAAEEKAEADNPDKPSFHLCIVNLVIGTLYCCKGNFEFGISRVVKSLEPYDKKLGPDTWYYAKRCLLALLEGMAKQMVVVPDSSIDDLLSFLEAADTHGKAVQTVVGIIDDSSGPGGDGALGAGSAGPGAGNPTPGVGGLVSGSGNSFVPGSNLAGGMANAAAVAAGGGAGIGGTPSVSQEARLLKRFVLRLRDELL